MFKSLRNNRLLPLAAISAVLCLMLLTSAPAGAQPVESDEPDHVVLNDAGDEVAPGMGLGLEDPFTAEELTNLVAPVALYPDDLLAIVLPASTYPLQIVQAARFLDEFENDSSLKPDEDWDESVIALLNYPEVIDLLNSDLEWTWQLGEAVINQETEVIEAVEAFRDRAMLAGNLKTDEHQIVSEEDGTIEITPAEAEVIYVPYYEPERVVVYQPYPVYHYYPRPYPLYYYPYPVGYHFSSGFFWGITTAFTIGWHSHHLNVHFWDYYSHPYYGHTYYRSHHYYHWPSRHYGGHRYAGDPRHDGDHWRPNRRHGARPDHRSPRFDRGGNDFVATSGGSRIGRPGTFKPRPGFRGKIINAVNTRYEGADFRTNVRPAVRTTRDARRPARRDAVWKYNATPKSDFVPRNSRSSGKVRRSRPDRDQVTRDSSREPVVQNRSRGNRVSRSAVPTNQGRPVNRSDRRYTVRTSRPDSVASDRSRGRRADAGANSSGRVARPSPPPRQARPASRPSQSRAPESRPSPAASRPTPPPRSERGRSEKHADQKGTRRNDRGRSRARN